MSIVIQSLADDDRVLLCCTFLNFLRVFSFAFLVESEITLGHMHMHTHVTTLKCFLSCSANVLTKRGGSILFSPPYVAPLPLTFINLSFFSAMYRILNPLYYMLKRSFMQRFLEGGFNTITTLWYTI